jgi:hypothetical protein
MDGDYAPGPQAGEDAVLTEEHLVDVVLVPDADPDQLARGRHLRR